MVFITSHTAATTVKSTAPRPPSASTAEEGCSLTFLIFQTVTSSVCEDAQCRFNIHLLHGSRQNRQPRAVIGGPVLRDRRRAEEQLNHLDIHQEVATQKATAAVSSPID